MIVAVFSYRHDAVLVPALLANLAPLVHAWVSWDDRQATMPQSDEPSRRNRLLAAARAMGAAWILAVDPDERFETGLKDKIAAMTGPGVQTLWSFELREMYGPDAYRVDGVWGGKAQVRLFPAAIAQQASDATLHGKWYDNSAGLPVQRAGLDLYHLRMATPARRQNRRDTYAAADPERRFQRIGYDYLADDRGMLLEGIPPDRGFLPPHLEDGGLWAPAVADAGGLAADPAAARLLFSQASLRHRGAGSAALALRDIVAADPADADLIAAAAHQHLEAGDHAEVDACATLLAPHALAKSYGLSVQARSRAVRGDLAGAGAACAGARQAGGGNRYLDWLAQILPEQTLPEAVLPEPDQSREADLTAAGANWRRWTTGLAQLHCGAGLAQLHCGAGLAQLHCGAGLAQLHCGAGEARVHCGGRVAQADLAVVVIGYQAPAELRSAVQSLLAQDVIPEIVVVNSGGGDAAALLADLMDRIILITLRRRLFVGAARNIGIDASRAPYVAFLAADCRAAPGWVSGRLARHRGGNSGGDPGGDLAGALMVSTPVVPDRPRNLYSRAAAALLHWRRRPDVAATAVLHYGCSYARPVFLSHGYFAPGLRTGEDSEFHLRICGPAAPVGRVGRVGRAGPVTPVWAPEVLTLHRYPTRLLPFLRDGVARSIRRTLCPPFSSLAAPPAVWRQALALALTLALTRHRVAVAAFRARPENAGAQGVVLRGLMALALAMEAVGLAIGYRRLARTRADLHARTRADLHARTRADLHAQDQAQNPGATGAADPAGPQDQARFLALHQDWKASLLQARTLCLSPLPADALRARAILTAITRIAPAETTPVMMLCDLLVRLGQPDAALAAAEAALIAAPGNPHVWSKAGLLARQAGQTATAVFYGQGALARAPANLTIHRSLEAAYRALPKPYLARRRAALHKALSKASG